MSEHVDEVPLTEHPMLPNELQKVSLQFELHAWKHGSVAVIGVHAAGAGAGVVEGEGDGEGESPPHPCNARAAPAASTTITGV